MNHLHIETRTINGKDLLKSKDTLPVLISPAEDPDPSPNQLYQTHSDPTTNCRSQLIIKN